MTGGGKKWNKEDGCIAKVEDARMIDREMTGWENGGKKEKKRNEKKKLKKGIE